MEYDIEDLMSNAIAQKPMEFESAFKSIITDRIADAIDAKKAEIAKTLFNKTDKQNNTEESE
jgi:hypothetical protein